jgi:Tfp pilus assembly protein PilF
MNRSNQIAISKKSFKKVSKSNFFENKCFQILLILIVGIIAYSNTFNVPFQWDEDMFIKHNPIIKDLGNFLEPSKARDYPLYADLILRYVTYLTFAMNYNIHGYAVKGYHVVNLAIHLMNALFVYFLISLSFKTPFLRDSQLKDDSGFIALFGALLFVAHPIQTMAVTYIYQRLASLSAFFYLLSLFSYIKSRLSLTNPGRFMFYGLSLLSAIIAMKTKENAFTLPFVIVLFEFLFFSGHVKKRLLRLTPLLLTLFIIPISLVLTGRPLAGYVTGQVSHVPPSRYTYLLTQFKVLVTYIKLLFFPVGQTVVDDFPVSRSFFEIKVVLSFLLLLGLFCFGIYLFIRSRTTNTGLRLVAFGIFWFFITHAVESGIIPLLIYQEYRMYLPSAGVFLAFSAGIFLMFKTLRNSKAVALSVIIAVTCTLSVVTYARNRVWRDGISLWEDAAGKFPDSIRANYNLGLAYQQKGLNDVAINYYETVIKLNPSYAKAYNNLGVIYGQQGQLEKAFKIIRTAVNLDPDFAEAHTNLGVINDKLGHVEEAVREFRAAISIDPGYVTAHVDLGVIYVKHGRIEKAAEEFQSAMKLDPYQDEAKEYLEIIKRIER